MQESISHAQGRLVLMKKEFSPEVAEEILFATRSFMRRLADGLPASELALNAAAPSIPPLA